MQETMNLSDCTLLFTHIQSTSMRIAVKERVETWGSHVYTCQKQLSNTRSNIAAIKHAIFMDNRAVSYFMKRVLYSLVVVQVTNCWQNLFPSSYTWKFILLKNIFPTTDRAQWRLSRNWRGFDEPYFKMKYVYAKHSVLYNFDTGTTILWLFVNWCCYFAEHVKSDWRCSRFSRRLRFFKLSLHSPIYMYFIRHISIIKS